MNDRIPETPPVILPVTPGLSHPVWSVMIPTYNCIDYIREAIESVLTQDLGIHVMQIEVVDDCSTDGDVETLVKAVGKGRVQYFRQKLNVGSLRNFETCINHARGNYIHILHGDDRVEFGFYKEIDYIFNTYPEAGAAFTNYSFINCKSQSVKVSIAKILEEPGIIPDFLLKIAENQIVQPPAIVVKRRVYEDLGSFYAVHYGEDWEMWTRIASRYPVAYSPKCLASYRISHRIGISHKYFQTGENITDIRKVIDIIQSHLPVAKRAASKKAALYHFALGCIKVANNLLISDRRAAFRQMKGALSMSRNITILLLVFRFYFIYIFHLKQIKTIIVKKRMRI